MEENTNEEPVIVVRENVITEEIVTPVNSSSTDSGVEELVDAALVRAEEVRNELKREVMEEFLRGCISFERTGYYCVKEDELDLGEIGASGGAPTVASEQDASGYKQIVVTRNGVRTELTHDGWDNAFPTQDISGEHFVWQGMKNGRWQIFFGDTTEAGAPKVLQVTDSKESNFNPKVDGDRLVWQGWIDDNWEIFLATGRDDSPFADEHLPLGNRLLNVGADWSVERLTTNKAHDMFPSLHGEIVTWQSREGDAWIVYAYSIRDGTKTRLSSDGVKSENPRFTITWEERDPEGNARLMSYDMSTGKKSDLTEQAKHMGGGQFPENIPSPISQPNQATLPTATSTGTSTPVRGDDDTGGGNLLLP